MLWASFLLIGLVVAFDFSQFFGGGGGGGGFHRERDEEVSKEGGRCKGFLCGGDLSGPCVASPEKCPCRHPKQVRCQLASGHYLCLPPDVSCERLKKQF